MIEIVKNRTHNTKTFVHPTDPNKRILEVNSGLLHYHDGERFKDITPIPFPEGKLIESETDLEMVTVPDWGTAKVEDKGKTVRIYDKQGVSIYRYTSPLVAPSNVSIFKVVSQKTRVAKSVNFDAENIVEEKRNLNPEKEILIRDDSLGTEVEFEVVGDKIKFKLPEGVEAKNLKAYDDTDTSSTNDKDTYLRKSQPTTNFGSGNLLFVNSNSSEGARSIIAFTLPSDPGGTITDIDITFTTNLTTSQSNDPGPCEVHELTQTGWVESQATWNVYSTGNNWTTAGGDYSATVVDSVANATIISSTNGDPITFTIQGSGATNPLSLDWTDTTNLLLKWQSENGSPNADWWFMYSKEETTSSYRPVMTITYTPTGGAFVPKIIMS